MVRSLLLLIHCKLTSKMQATTYGRHRQSIADIEHQLYTIFTSHPTSNINDAGEPVIPADALVDVFRAFSDEYDGVELMTADELDMLKALLASNPGLEVTPQILLGFIAEKTKHSPPRSPLTDEDVDLPDGRGRGSDRDYPDDDGQHHGNLNCTLQIRTMT